jgi:type II secretory pathway pseudopilin PulG
MRGDTIVEVLIVMAILGSSLALSYAVANQSLLQGRDAQEHTEALNILQGQIEQLRDFIITQGTQTSSVPYVSQTSEFCFDSSGKLIHPGGLGEFSTPTSFISNFLPVNTGNCIQNFYHYFIYSYGNLANSNYTAYCVWPSVLGNGNSQVTLSYKVYPGSI